MPIGIYKRTYENSNEWIEYYHEKLSKLYQYKYDYLKTYIENNND
jgi:hypothetical protein